MRDKSELFSRRSVLAAGSTVGAGVFLGTAFAQQDGEDGEDGQDAEDGEDGEEGEDAEDGESEEEEARRYRVTVTNLTRGQPFTPPAVAAHSPDVEVFSVGDPANEPIRQLAENGNLDPLVGLVEETDSIRGAAVGDAPLVPESNPGGTDNPYFTTLELSADESATHMTFVSMLIATNDGIVGLDTVELPDEVNESQTYYANGYDVGTEQNTEEFADLVPPAQALTAGGSVDEGTAESNEQIAEDAVIRPHPGIQGNGDLTVEEYDWREPAAAVQVERVEVPQQEFEASLSGDNQPEPVETEASGTATFSLGENGEELSYEVTVADIENAFAAHIHCGPAGENGPIGVTLYEGDPVSAGQEEDGSDGEGSDGEGSEDGEQSDGEGSNGEGSDGEGSDGESSDGEGSDGEGSDGESSDGEGSDGEGSDGEGSDSEDSDGEGSDGEGSDGEQEQEEIVLAEGTITEPDEGNECGYETVADVLAAMRDGNAYVNVHTEANPGGEIRGQIE